MKNFTNNFKQFTSRLSARWLIMALMLLLGTSSAWAATRTYNGTEKLYVSDPGDSWWNNDGAYTAAYFYGSNGSAWTNAKQINGVIALNIPAGTWTHVIMVRLNNSTPDWNNKISDNQTGDIPLPTTGDYIKDFKRGSTSATWSTYTPPCDPPTLALTTTSATVNKGDEVNLTTLSGATASNGGTIEWSTSDTGSPVIDANVTISATTTYYAKAVKDDCKSASQSFTITAACTTDFYLVGSSSAIFGAEWNPAQTANKMDCNSNSLTKTYTNITVAANTTIEYKITDSNGWKGAQYPSNGNASFTIETAGTYNITFTATTDGTNITGAPNVTWVSSCNSANVQINSGPSNICPGGSTTFTYTAAAGANITWKMESASNAFTFSENNGTVTVRHSNPSTIVNGANKILYTVTDANNICPASDVDTKKTITLLSVPSITASTSPTQNICYGTEATLTVTGNQGTYTWENSNGGEEINSTKNSVTVSKAGTYTVTAQNAGGCTSNEITFTITVKDQVAAPTLNSNNTTVCGGEPFTLPSIDGVTWSLDDNPTTGSQSGIPNNTDEVITKTFKAVKEVDGCPSAPANYTVTVNPTPTITGKSVTQPNTEITLTSIQGVTWSVSPTENVILTDNRDGTATFSASVVRDFVVSAQKENCSTEYTITVTDKGNIIYVRRPKSEDGNNYTYWYNPAFMGEEYYGTQNYIKNGDDFSQTASDNNQNGTAPTVPAAFTDCDGYVWDKFEVLGYESFFVHAPVQTGFGGYSTFTQKIDVALGQPEMYVTIGTWSSGLGAPITKVEAPSLVKVHALGSTTLGTDKFAALYVTDCSGKEIDAYQWEYCSPEGDTYDDYNASVSNSGTLYSGDAGTTNNIRPSVAGFYRCTVEYKGGGTATSAAVEIDGTYNRSFTSTIPVLVVNTGNKDFPGCQASGTNNYPSKYADDLKAKRSVDVKIYDGEGALVYDRKARMAYRGSSSLNFTKKSYAFCPGKANCGDEDKGADYVKTEKLNMLGVGNAVDKDWVLYAAAADPSLMRNRMVFDTYQAMRNDWGVHSRYVELIVNGDYKGVYVFMDKITMNENRVEVNEDNGFIVKFDKTDCADRVEGYNGIFGDQKTFSTERTGRYGISTYHTTVDQLFEIEYPEKDDYPTGWANKVASIKEMFQAFEDALEAGDYATVQKYIDYDSWADWFIINEFTKNLDAYRASCIFVYTGEAGSKIEARPLWDQELSFNNAAANISGKGANSTSGLLIQNDGVYTDCFPAPFWFTGQLATFGNCGVNNGSGEIDDKLANCLLNDPCFVQVVKEKWNQHQFDALSAEKLNALVTKYTNELGDAALERESNKWPNNFRTSADCSAGSTGYNEVSHSDSKKAITSWIADGAGGRREGLTTAINGLTGASFSIQIVPSEVTTTPWEPVEIAVSVTPDGYDYKLEYTDNDLGSVANTIIEEEGDKITYRIPRPWPAGDEQQEGERTDIEYGIKATLNVQDGTTVCGSQAAPSSTGKIILQDEPNDNCK